MADASPPKWHLAHTTWFFETFVLREAKPTSYKPFNDAYEYLFNSYYEGVGSRHPRAQRGLLSRPLVSEVYAYRHSVDDAMRTLFDEDLDAKWLSRIELGVHHEQQHQELLLTDLKFNLGHNPLLPKYADSTSDFSNERVADTKFIVCEGGKSAIGADRERFCFDNELPRHDVWLQPFELADRLVTNAEYLEFIDDGGYEDPSLWLSDGWLEKQTREWRAPEYWYNRDDSWCEYSLHGAGPVNPIAPVCHVSYYEADAFARWAGARLPTEAEWEVGAQCNTNGHCGTFADDGHFHPRPQQRGFGGDCWEWTSSSYAPYPGYRPLAGTLGEYNGKFMANQYVLRGGSCATPQSHYRHSYRNFFYSKDRWQFTGIRLARDHAS